MVAINSEHHQAALWALAFVSPFRITWEIFWPHVVFPFFFVTTAVDAKSKKYEKKCFFSKNVAIKQKKLPNVLVAIAISYSGMIFRILKLLECFFTNQSSVLQIVTLNWGQNVGSRKTHAMIVRPIVRNNVNR